MGKHSDKRNKRRVDFLRGQYTLTCIFRDPGHSSDECKVLNGFGTKYTKVKPFKERNQDPTFRKKFGNNPEVNFIVQRAVDEIILQ